MNDASNEGIDINGNPPRVVLGVDVLAGSLVRPECLGVINLWRDGQIKPVLHRALLRRYLEILKHLGANEKVLRGWMTWFIAPGKTVFLPDGEPGGQTQTLADLYLEAARMGSAAWIITPHPAPAPLPLDLPSLHWLEPEAILRRV